MKKKFKLSVPKPCHEDWSTMTPKEQGRFCASCSKTVVDFTQKSKEEIQQYLSDHFGKRVCGRFRREQLDTITLEIPTATFHQTLSYQKLFLLALLLAMGTTLFSCQNSNGTKQKIENVVVIDTVEEVYETGHLEIDKAFHIDSIVEIEEPETITEDVPSTLQSQDSIVILEEIGEVEVQIMGDIEPYEEEEEEQDFVMGYIIEEHPRFPEARSLSIENVQEDFNRRMRLFFKEHFKTPQGDLGLQKKRYRIITQFDIDTLGEVRDIKVRTPHPAITREVQRVLHKLPVFIPGKQGGKLVNTKYVLPIRLDLNE